MGVPQRKTDQLYTYADYAGWPEDERWELIDGVAWNMSPAPARKHQGISGELFGLLRDYLKGKKCRLYAAPFDVFFPEYPGQPIDEVSTVVQPDLSVICDPEKLIDKGCFGAPDLVVEILSPYTSRKDLNEKFRLYESRGVREYWVLYPDSRSVCVYRMTPGGTFNDGTILENRGTAASGCLPGFSVDVKELFDAAL